MKMPESEQMLLSAAEPVRRQISDLAEGAPPAAAKLLRKVGKRLLDSSFQVTKSGDGSKRRRDKQATEFHRVVGSPLAEFVLRARLEVARHLLTSTDLDIDQIPGLVALSRAVFYDRFKKQFGKSPSEIRASGTDSPDAALLAEPKSVLGPLLEISTAGFDEEVIANWLAGVACELSPVQGRAALKETSFDSPALFEALSERSREEGRRDTLRGIEIADLALSSLEGSASVLGDVGLGLRARGLARLANARRLANDHIGAEREFRRAEQVLAKIPPAQRAAVQGEFLGCRGTLRLFQRRFDEAGEDLHRAVALCRSTSQGRLEALARIQLASLSNYIGDSEAAGDHLLSARRLAEKHFGGDRYLRLLLTTQAACIHAESGHHSEALALIPEARQLATLLENRKAEFQLDWIESIARRAESEAAERLLRRARQGFLTLHDIDYTAIVSLDLALVYEEQGHSAEVVSLAAEALPALESLQLPEAAAAVSMLRRAIEDDMISRALLMKIRALLNPTLGFRSS